MANEAAHLKNLLAACGGVGSEADRQRIANSK
jgi:hypothetical protein